jgi:glucose-6-phosphate isomerase
MIELPNIDSASGGHIPKERLPSLQEAWDKVFKLQDAKFYELPARKELWTDSVKRAEEIQKKYDATCMVGIGGSSLGARALYQAFEPTAKHKVIFAEAPDETAVAGWRKQMGPLAKVHFVFCSKSGKTLETLSLLDYFHQTLAKEGLDLAKQATVICGAATSPLRNWAVEQKIPILPVPEDVGGRFSVLTPVGILPAALMGVSVEKMRVGAEWALKQKDLIFKLCDAGLESFAEDKWISQMWIYSGSLHTLGLWWQQLWSESLGKKVKRSGAPAPRASTPMVCLGPQDQHSLLQQVQEGDRDKWILLLRDSDAEKSGLGFTSSVLKGLDSSFGALHLGEVLKAEVEGFLGALKEAKVPHLVMKASSSQPEAWGAFFMTWMLVIAVMGEHAEINAFDQPGVELGKRLALQSLRQRL